MGVDRRGNYRGKCTACDCDEFELPPVDDTNMCLFCGHHSPLHERVNETCIREENLMGNEDSRQTVPLTVQCASNTVSEGNGTVSYEENTSDVQSASNPIEQQDNPTTAQENNSEVRIYECLLCGLIYNKKARLIHHINVVHTHRSKHTIICYCRKCNLYFSVLTEFKSHKYVALPLAYDIPVELQQNETNTDIDNVNVMSDLHEKELNLADRILDFCVLLEAKHKVPKVAINAMVNFLGCIGHENDISLSVTDRLRKRQLSKNGVYLNPKQIHLPDGTSGYVISVIDIIRNLAKFNENLSFFRKNAPLSDNRITDVMQGQRYRNHPGQVAHEKNNIALLLYNDDIELCNPIGMHRGLNKICLFYVTVLNIPVQLRSRLAATFCIAVCSSKSMKSFKAHEILLNDFISELKILASTGITIPSDSYGEKFYGYLFAYHGDALAVHQLCGFKECFSPLVKQQCRMCTASSELFPTLSYHYQCPVRDEVQYYKIVDEMKKTRRDKTLYSKKSRDNGIKRDNIFREIPFFNIFKDVLYDPMHILLEGIVPKEISLLLKAVVSQRLIKRDHLNSLISNFKFHKSIPSGEKPRLIPQDFSISGTSKANFTLMYHLPILLHRDIPTDNQHWQCFLLLIAIVKLIWSPILTVESLAAIEVHEHQNLYVKLYPGHFSPKLHMGHSISDLQSKF
ncbi:PREDICTED: uncharacterized protein LOC105557481 [Vollenhovia emeryi]|uniref:uncharacterized protein LOC105557481 n=1 Tax=Vollenhovia emeryi TaxID=411798 RepID=UPI0005F3D7B0|nr:PREDICTED: uncharacterized protein LOC105557481 [Vollenhovia emeryi]